jgi:hypothetical protein
VNILNGKMISFPQCVLLDRIDYEKRFPFQDISMTALLYHTLLKKLAYYQTDNTMIPLGHFFGILSNFHNERAFDLIGHSAYRGYLDTTYGFYCDKAMEKKKTGKSLNDYEKIILNIKDTYGTFWNIPYPETRQIGRYRAYYNPFLAFKQGGVRSGQQGILCPFNDDQFNFKDTRMFVEENIVLELIVHDRREYRSTFIYNPFPYVKGHMLLVPFREAGLPQFLSEEVLDSWAMFRRLFPFIRMAWNSYNAGGSVNHAHFHLSDETFPVQNIFDHEVKASWRIDTVIFDHSDPAARIHAAGKYILDNIHDRYGALKGDDYYNILDATDRTYLFLRKRQGIIDFPMGWTGVAGRITLKDRVEYEQLSQEKIENILSQQSNLPK